jgi:hypothetical protein
VPDDAAVVADGEETGTFGVYGPGATEPSRASVEVAAVGRRPVELGRAHGESAGTAGVPAGLSPVAAAAAPTAAAAAPAVAAAAPAVAAPGVTDEDPPVDRAGAPVAGELDGPSAASDSDDDPSVSPGVPNAPVRAPAALAGPDFFRPRRSSSDFFGGVPPAGPALLDPALGAGVGAGPGSGDGTGEAEAADRGADVAEVAEAPDSELGPEAAPRPRSSDADPPTGVADWAERAE